MHSTREGFAITHIINYLRRSRQDLERERRTGEDTLAEQKLLMDRVLSEYGIPYTQKMEIGSGDKIATRPVFLEILKELRAGTHDAIAVKELSRLGRGSYADMGQIYDLLRERRIYVLTPWRIYDPTNAADARQIRFELFLSREEFETTRERLLGARYNYALQGKWMAGSVPYGYRFDASTQRLVSNEEEAWVVRLIFDLYAHGYQGRTLGTRAIATHLQRLRIRTAKGLREWRAEVIARILRKPVYIGQVRFRITEKREGKPLLRPQSEWIVVDGAHEPLIDEGLFQSVQRQLSRKGQTIPRTRLDCTTHELAGLVHCGACGRTMVRRVSSSRYTQHSGEIRVYRQEMLCCKTRGCTTVKYRAVEESILAVLCAVRVDAPDVLARDYMVECSRMRRMRDDMRRMSVKQLIRRRSDLERKVAFIYDKYEAGVYSDAEFVSRKQAIEQELAELADCTEPSVHRDDWIAVDEASARWTKYEDLAALYLALSEPGLKNELLRALFSRVSVDSTPPGQGSRRSLMVMLTTSWPQLLVAGGTSSDGSATT